MEENIIEPYFCLGKASGISEYVKFWLDEYSKDPRRISLVHDKLRVIFSDTSAYQIKVLDGYKFGAVFSQRLGRRRLQSLKFHLEIINKDRYSRIDWVYYLGKRRIANAAA